MKTKLISSLLALVGTLVMPACTSDDVEVVRVSSPTPVTTTTVTEETRPLYSSSGYRTGTTTETTETTTVHRY